MWSKLRRSKLVILGNGESRAAGVDFAKEYQLPVIAINQLPDDLQVIFSIITRVEKLQELAPKNSRQVPLIVPSGFPLVECAVMLPIAQLDYLEGVPLSKRMAVEFREDFVLLTILHLMNTLSEPSASNTGNLEVHLFGFDFQLSQNVTSESQNSFLESLLIRQKSIFEMLLKIAQPFEQLTLFNHSVESTNNNPYTIKEINKSVPFISDISLRSAIEKNIELQQQMFVLSGDGEVQIVAELTNNHLGDTNRLVEMVRQCKDQGASAIKVQKRDIQVLYTDKERMSPYLSPFGSTLGDYRAGVELSIEQFSLLTTICAELEIPWFTSVLDLPSLNLIKQFKPLCIKAPSTISEHKNFLKKIADSEVEYIFISTGATTQAYLDWVIENFAQKNLVLMQCTSSYPTAPEDCNVGVVKTISRLNHKKDIIPGYSSHDIGSLASQLAVANGARFIEKHIKLGSVDWVHFDGVALDLSQNELDSFVKDIRLAEKVIGSEVKQQLVSEHHKYKPNLKHN